MKRFLFLCFLVLPSALQAAILPKKTHLQTLNTNDNILGYLFQFTVDQMYFDVHLIRQKTSSIFYKNGVCSLGIEGRIIRERKGSADEIQKGDRFKVNHVLLAHYDGHYQDNYYLSNPSWKVTLLLESKKTPIVDLFLECLLPKSSVSSNQLTIGTLIQYSGLPMVFLD